MSISDEVKNKAFTICKQFLGGCWTNVEFCDFSISHISGGLSNFLYQCEISNPEIKVLKQEPRKVLLRLYGSIIHEHPETVVTDSVIYALLAEKQLGPNLFGVFPGGRVEEYVEARHLRSDELSSPIISQEIAKIMARFHHMTMPLCKEPFWLEQTMNRYFKGTLKVLEDRHTYDVARRAMLNKIAGYNLESEIVSLKHILSQVKSPVVFCHNDLQEGNILIFESDSPKKELLAIDFEYCGYNFRGFDIGNHFVEWCYNYHEINTYPYFSADILKYPSAQQQQLFIQAYLQAAGINREPDEGDQNLEEHIMLEALVYALASHFMWALWSVIQATKSDIRFGYMEYALARFEGYFAQKAQLPAYLMHNGIPAGDQAATGDS